jgi:hypothetical protein
MPPDCLLLDFLKKECTAGTQAAWNTLKLDADRAYAGIHPLHEKMEKAA